MNRGDPFALLLTATANFVSAAPYLEEGRYKDMAATLMASTMRLIGDKSYMKSIGDLVDAAQGDERALGRLARGFVTGFTAPNLIREARQGYDDVLRDINTVEGAVLNSIPGFSSALPAKHDWLTGKPVAGGLPHLFGISPVNEDAVAYELAKLGGVYKGLPYEFNDIKLTEAQHSRYGELMGTIKLDGKTLHQMLNAAIHSREYDSGRSGPLEDKHRSDYLNKIITTYRKAAGYALLQENPDFTAIAEAEGRAKKKKLQLIQPPRTTGEKTQDSRPTHTQRKGADALAALIQ